jgi:hypothetical protein
LFLRTDGLSLFPADLPSSGSFHFLPAETTFPGGKMNFSLTQNCADFNRCPFGSAWSLGRAMSIDEIRTHDRRLGAVVGTKNPTDRAMLTTNKSTCVQFGYLFRSDQEIETNWRGVFKVAVVVNVNKL